MGSPRITQSQQEKYLTLRGLNFSIRRAAQQAMVSESWAKAFERNLRNSSGREWARSREESKLPAPIPVEELSSVARDCLDDFERWRLRYTGHVSTPWQVETAQLVVELLPTPEKEYVIENVAPGTGKTTLKRDIAAWMTCRDRRLRGMFGSAVVDNATKDLRALRRMLEETRPPKAKPTDRAAGLAVDAVACLSVEYGLFKPTTLDIWRGDEFVVAQFGDEPLTDKEATWTAYGKDSTVTSNRFDLIFWDDVDNKDTIASLNAIMKHRLFWDDEAETRLELRGLLWLIMQRLHPQDLSAYNRQKMVPVDEHVEGDADAVVEGEDERPQYTHICFPAHDESRCDPEVTHRRDAEAWPDGCLLDPKRLPWVGKGGLAAIQMSKPRTYQIQYQQEDVDPDDVLAKDVWIDGGIDPEDGSICPGCWDDDRDLCELPKGLIGPKYSSAFVDPSGSNFWALQWWIDTPDALDRQWLMDIERKRMPANELLDWHNDDQKFVGIMEDWQARSVALGYPITHWVVEVNACQKHLLQYEHVQRWMTKWNVKIVPHTTGQNKVDPDRGPWTMRDDFRFGKIRLPGKSSAGSNARRQSMHFVREATHWPNGGTTDDEVLAGWFHKLWRPVICRRRKRARHGPPDRPSWLRGNTTVRPGHHTRKVAS